MTRPRLLCTVRGCREPLVRGAGALACSRGHSFDLSRSGYVNLLQPQDRRSKTPGDSRTAAEARRRWMDRGHERELVGEALAALDPASSGARTPSVLDLGCGEGTFLGSLAGAREIEAHGLDLSVPAVELAARRYPRLTWVVANADRTLPYPDEAFDFVLSVAARRNGPEIRRVLSGEGRALFVVPAEDDLIEVRRALLGRGDRRDRSAAAIDALSPHLELVERRAWKRRASLGARDVADLLASTYRGARFSQRDRAGEIAPLDVTLSRELLLFRRIRGR